MVRTTLVNKKGDGYSKLYKETNEQEKELSLIYDKEFDDQLYVLDTLLEEIKNEPEEKKIYFIESYFDEIIIEDSDVNPDLQSKEIIERGKIKFGPLAYLINQITKEGRKNGNSDCSIICVG